MMEDQNLSQIICVCFYTLYNYLFSIFIICVKTQSKRQFRRKAPTHQTQIISSFWLPCYRRGYTILIQLLVDKVKDQLNMRLDKSREAELTSLEKCSTGSKVVVLGVLFYRLLFYIGGLWDNAF